MVTDVEFIQWQRKLGINIDQHELLTLDQKKMILPIEYSELMEANNDGKVHPWIVPFVELAERQIMVEQVERLFGVIAHRFSFRKDETTGQTINIIESELLPLLMDLLYRGTPPKECDLCE